MYQGASFSISASCFQSTGSTVCFPDVLCLPMSLSLCSQLCSQLAVPSHVLSICYSRCQTKRLSSNTVAFPKPSPSFHHCGWHRSIWLYLSYSKHLILDCIIVTGVNIYLAQKRNHILCIIYTFKNFFARAHYFC